MQKLAVVCLVLFALVHARLAAAACGYGFYCPDSDPAQRVQCPPQSNTTTDTATNLSACLCGAGFFQPPSMLSCSPCTPGFYCPGLSNTKLACSPGETSAYRASAASDCACERGTQRAGPNASTCQTCEEDVFCEGGAAAAQACPAHAHSLRGSGSVHDCTCLLPRLLVPAGPSFACVHALDLPGSPVLARRQLPVATSQGLESTISIELDALTPVQRQAIHVDAHAQCAGVDGAVRACVPRIHATMTNSTHALVFMQHALLDAAYISLFFSLFQDARLAQAVYMRQRDVWLRMDGSAEPVGVPGHRLAFAVSMELGSAEEAGWVHRERTALVSHIKSLVHQNESVDGTEVFITDQHTMLSYAAYAAVPDVSACVGAVAGAVKIDDEQFVDLGAVPCPDPDVFACLVGDRGGTVRCRVQVVVYHSAEHALAPEIAAGLEHVVHVHTTEVLPARFVRYWDEGAAPGEIGASFAAEHTWFDSGTHSAAFWLVQLSPESLQSSGNIWDEILLASNFSSTWSAWAASSHDAIAAHALAPLHILGHTTESSSMFGSVSTSLRAAGDNTVSLQVRGYALGRHDAAGVLQNLCVLAGCGGCNVTVTSGTLAVAGTTAARVPAFVSAQCNVTRRGGVELQNATCAARRYSVVISVHVPLSPAIVSAFLTDVIVASIVGVRTTTGAVSVAADGAASSLVQAEVQASSLQACQAEDHVDMQTLHALLSALWTADALPAVQYQCRVYCTSEQLVHTPEEWAALENSTASCRADVNHTTILPDSAELAALAVTTFLPRPVAGSEVAVHIDAVTTCPALQLAQTFDALFLQQYTPPTYQAADAALLFSAPARGWNADEREECMPRLGVNTNTRPSCAPRLRAWAAGNCFHVSGTNMRLDPAHVANFVAAQSTRLLPSGAQGLLTTERLAGTGLWLEHDAPVLASLASYHGLNVTSTPGWALREQLYVPRTAPYAADYESRLLQAAEAVQPDVALFKNEATIVFYTVTSLHEPGAYTPAMEFSLQLLELLTMHSVFQGVTLHNVTHARMTTPLSSAVDVPDKEYIMTVNASTTLSCHAMHAVLQDWRPLKLPFFDAYLHMQHAGFACGTALLLTRTAASCAARAGLNVSAASAACAELHPMVRVDVAAADSGVFFQALDAAGGNASRLGVSFTHDVAVCGGGDAEAELAARALEAYGTYAVCCVSMCLCLCVCVVHEALFFFWRYTDASVVAGCKSQVSGVFSFISVALFSYVDGLVTPL